MVRLADLPDFERAHMLDKLKGLEEFNARPWVKPPPLAQCRIAIVSTAGLMRAATGRSARARQRRTIGSFPPIRRPPTW